MTVPWTIGVVRHGIADPSETRTAPELCAVCFHPPVTYNPWVDRTWCLCGAKTWAGNLAAHGFDCCDGPLIVEMEDRGDD